MLTVLDMSGCRTILESLQLPRTKKNKASSLRQPLLTIITNSMNMVWQTNIALFSFFPAHATHILQPLDVDVYSRPLDRYCGHWSGSGLLDRFATSTYTSF